jgi:SprA-related family
LGPDPKGLQADYEAIMDAIASIGKTGGRTKLTPDEMAEVAQMAARDREVRAQETARLAAAGMLANGVDYVYAQGPDGKMYAVAGKVRITTIAAQSPEETLANARQIHSAVAGATADSSSEDGAVAMRAGQLEAEALREIANERAATKHTPAPEQGPSHGHKLNDTA